MARALAHTFDTQTLAGLFQGPGQDTRQWVSYGTVEIEADGQPSSEFTKEYGPLVNVTLHPSGIDLRCRVAMQVAGNGEAEFTPFIQGDEVLVVIVEGDERAGGVIIGRLCQEIDVFPETVAGSETNKNNFAFSRRRTPYIFETSTAWLVRQATNSASIALAQNGNITLTEGNKGFMHVGADFIGMQTGDAMVTLQIGNINGENIATAEVEGKAKWTMSVADCQMVSPGTITLGAGGIPSIAHAATVEGVINIIASLLPAIGAAVIAGLNAGIVTPAAGAPLGPLIGAPLGLVFNTPEPLLLAAIAAAGTGSIAPYLSLIGTTIATKQADPTGLKPNLGCPSVMTG